MNFSNVSVTVASRSQWQEFQLVYRVPWTSSSCDKLADDCCLVSDSTRRSLRSADGPTCVLPRTLSSYGDNFCSRWASLPVKLRNPRVQGPDFQKILGQT